MAEASQDMERRGARGLGYGGVFLLLALVTALEVWLGSVGVVRAVRTVLFLALSLFKASMVAAYYMHLRSDSRLYAYILITPAALLLVFSLIAAVP
jgi:cytochrome c oxidase subunit IV